MAEHTAPVVVGGLRGFTTAIALVALAFAISWAARDKVLPRQADAANYLAGARSLVETGRYLSISDMPQTTFPPGYSLAIAAAATATDDIETAARLVAAGSSAVATGLIFVIAGFLGGYRAGLAAGALWAVLPFRVRAATVIYSEHLFAAVTLVALLLVLLELGSDRPRLRWGLALCTGVLFGFAHLVRPEAVGLLAVGCASIAWMAWSRRRGVSPVPRLQSIAVMVLAFALVVTPYTCYLHSHTGRWAISTKLAGNLRVAPGKSAGVSWVELRRLNADATDYVPVEVEETLLDTIRRYAINAEEELNQLSGILSPLLLLAIGAGLLSDVWRTHPSRPGLAIGFVLLPLLVYPAFFVQQRFLLGLLPVLLVWAGVGVSTTSRAGRRTRIVLVLILCATLAFYAWSIQGLYRSPDASDWERELGEWMHGHGITDARMLSKHYGVDYYARTVHIAIPYAELPTLLRFARHRGASYLLVNASDQVPESVRILAAGDAAQPSLELVKHMVEADGDDIALYHILRDGGHEPGGTSGPPASDPRME